MSRAKREIFIQEGEDIPIGTKIRVRRDFLGLYHRHLAEIAGCSLTLISLIEGGKKRPTKTFLDKVAPLLGLTVEGLVGADYAKVKGWLSAEIIDRPLRKSLDRKLPDKSRTNEVLSNNEIISGVVSFNTPFGRVTLKIKEAVIIDGKEVWNKLKEGNNQKNR